MKYFLFILSIFLIGCQTNSDPVENDDVSPKLVEPIIIPPNPDYQEIIMHRDLDTMLTMIGASLTDKDYSSSFWYIDPLQMAIQSEEIELDSCQNVVELVHLKKAAFDSYCNLLSNISEIEFTGFKKESDEIYHIIGKAKLSNNTEQEISFQINILGENMFVISGAVG